MSIVLTDAAYTYHLAGGESIQALSPTTLSVSPGEFVAVVGANGSGKSTLAKLMNGLLFSTTGNVAIDGRSVMAGQNDLFARRTVGMVFQNPENQLVATIVEDDVAFGPENLGVPREEIRRRVDEALKKVSMTEYAHADPHSLSAGQRQRVAIAGMMAMRPRYMVLDEPTALLDPQGRREVLAVIAELRERETIGVAYITHIIEEVVAADKVLVLKDGRVIASGPPREVLVDQALMERASLYSPKAGRLASALAGEGIGISPDLITDEEVADAICSSS